MDHNAPEPYAIKTNFGLSKGYVRLELIEA